eukprot:TRINITY_DN43010_c0_g1_i1.p1 TRINITY_DN43010_c0_g1~~TRINITY_DN43010_c0_g1_i1.p1  ORF type:complete len:905 (+),score=136.30 TRINITY_DN43010_c0_g1_i1:292-3006(+)
MPSFAGRPRVSYAQIHRHSYVSPRTFTTVKSEEEAVFGAKDSLRSGGAVCHQQEVECFARKVAAAAKATNWESTRGWAKVFSTYNAQGHETLTEAEFAALLRCEGFVPTTETEPGLLIRGLFAAVDETGKRNISGEQFGEYLSKLEQQDPLEPPELSEPLDPPQHSEPTEHSGSVRPSPAPWHPDTHWAHRPMSRRMAKEYISQNEKANPAQRAATRSASPFPRWITNPSYCKPAETVAASYASAAVAADAAAAPNHPDIFRAIVGKDPRTFENLSTLLHGSELPLQLEETIAGSAVSREASIGCEERWPRNTFWTFRTKHQTETTTAANVASAHGRSSSWRGSSRFDKNHIEQDAVAAREASWVPTGNLTTRTGAWSDFPDPNGGAYPVVGSIYRPSAPQFPKLDKALTVQQLLDEKLPRVWKRLKEGHARFVGDAFLRLEDFSALLRRAPLRITWEELTDAEFRLLFRYLDTDANGEVAISDLQAFVRHEVERYRQRPRTEDFTELLQKYRKAFQAVDDVEGGINWRQIFRVFCRPGGSGLRYIEFRRMIRRELKLVSDVYTDAEIKVLVSLLHDGDDEVVLDNFLRFIDVDSDSDSDRLKKTLRVALRLAGHQHRFVTLAAGDGASARQLGRELAMSWSGSAPQDARGRPPDVAAARRGHFMLRFARTQSEVRDVSVMLAWLERRCVDGGSKSPVVASSLLGRSLPRQMMLEANRRSTGRQTPIGTDHDCRNSRVDPTSRYFQTGSVTTASEFESEEECDASSATTNTPMQSAPFGEPKVRHGCVTSDDDIGVGAGGVGRGDGHGGDNSVDCGLGSCVSGGTIAASDGFEGTNNSNRNTVVGVGRVPHINFAKLRGNELPGVTSRASTPRSSRRHSLLAASLSGTDRGCSSGGGASRAIDP